MFQKATNPNDRLSLYRDVLAVYKKLIAAALKQYGMNTNAVEIKNNMIRNINRAPLIVIERGDYQYIPRSLMLSEHLVNNASTNKLTSLTAHMLEYPIEFTCYGNSYLEAEKLGGLAMETVLTTGMTIVKTMHPNIIGADLVSWSKTDFVEGGDSSLLACIVLGKVFLKVDGTYTIDN